MAGVRKIVEGQELTYEDVNDLYFGEWVLLKITRLGEDGDVSHGCVLDHTPDRGKISRSLKRIWKHEPEARVAIFPGGTRRTGGHEFRRGVEGAAQRADWVDYVEARWDLLDAPG